MREDLDKKAVKEQLRLPRYFWVIVAAASVAFAAVIGVYISQFGARVADAQEIWGLFGDYVGGTLNPILSFLALIALLITVALQGRQIELSTKELELTRDELRRTADAAIAQAEHFRRQERRTDIYRLIETLAIRINKNFNENRLDEDKSLHWFVSFHDDDSQRNRISTIWAKREKPHSPTARTLRWLETDLERLAHYITQYEEFSDTTELSTPLPNFYRVEFGGMVNVLHKYQMISDFVHEFYCK